TALYRCGRQAEALAVQRDARTTLADELGLEPTRELDELERQILDHDPALAAPTAHGAPEIDTRVAAMSGPLQRHDPSRFVGRHAEQALIAERPAQLDGARLLTI